MARALPGKMCLQHSQQLSVLGTAELPESFYKEGGKCIKPSTFLRSEYYSFYQGTYKDASLRLSSSTCRHHLIR